MNNERNYAFVAFGFEQFFLCGYHRVPVGAEAVNLAALQSDPDLRRALVTGDNAELRTDHFVQHQRHVDAVRTRSGAAHSQGLSRFDDFIEGLDAGESHNQANRHAFRWRANPAEFARIELDVNVSHRLI